MSKKQMEQVEIYTSKEGYIVLSQPNFGDDDSKIIIHPDQVGILIKWLQDLKRELKKSKVNSTSRKHS